MPQFSASETFMLCTWLLQTCLLPTCLCYAVDQLSTTLRSLQHMVEQHVPLYPQRFLIPTALSKRRGTGPIMFSQPRQV